VPIRPAPSAPSASGSRSTLPFLVVVVVAPAPARCCRPKLPRRPPRRLRLRRACRRRAAPAARSAAPSRRPESGMIPSGWLNSRRGRNRWRPRFGRLNATSSERPDDQGQGEEPRAAAVVSAPPPNARTSGRRPALASRDRFGIRPPWTVPLEPGAALDDSAATSSSTVDARTASTDRRRNASATASAGGRRPGSRAVMARRV
jgi:hypothetical protein